MTIDIRKLLSPTLLPIYDLEISKGNIIERVDKPAGTLCPLAVIFKKTLHYVEIKDLRLQPEVQKYENKDRHYPLESGFFCKRSRHVVAGPTA